MLRLTDEQWERIKRHFPEESFHWCRQEILRDLLVDLANELRAEDELDESECFIDAMFSPAKGGGADIGSTKRGKGLKIMAIVDRHGLPLSVSAHAATHHESPLHD